MSDGWGVRARRTREQCQELSRSAGANLAHSSLAGSEVSLVRGFLNRILGADDLSEQPEDDSEDEDLTKVFDLGDETQDAEAALAAGDTFGQEGIDKKPEKTPSEAEQARRYKQRKATKEQIIAAAKAFGDRIRLRRENQLLDNYDVLRLRALLMIVCTAAWPGKESESSSQTKKSTMQVLPAEGDSHSWPVLIGRLLFSMFGGRDPAIRHLYLSTEHDQIPSDVIECWATCYWCLQACLNAPLSPKEKARIERYIKPLGELAYRYTLPTTDELMGDDVSALMDVMNKRYAEKLGVASEAISEDHRKLVHELFSTMA